MGAIIIIKSKDDKYLLVRNGKLWGLPKGVRHYKTFTQLQNVCNKTYLETGEIPVFTEVVFDEEETAKENIIRETLEETGIVLDPDKIVECSARRNQHPYIRFYYEADFTSYEYIKVLEQNGTDHENDEIMWQTETTILKLLSRHREASANSNKRIFNHVTYSYLLSYFKKQK
jgi:8-oxo-dGTP pyrophosphatase MutT (NUDIX family)